MAPHAETSDSDVSDNESSAAPARSQSRSQSRRARRRKTSASKDSSKKTKGKSGRNMSSVPEDTEASEQRQPQPSAQSSASTQQAQAQSAAEAEAEADPPTVEDTGMQPFEWIGPDSTSMSGPVTYAKAQRGEIPARPGNPEQKLETAKESGESDLMKQDGLKLRLELNLDIEIELKARIRGDLTLALLYVLCAFFFIYLCRPCIFPLFREMLSSTTPCPAAVGQDWTVQIPSSLPSRATFD